MYSNILLSVFKLFLMMSDPLPKLQLFPCSLSNILQKIQHNQKPAKPTPKPACNGGEKNNQLHHASSPLVTCSKINFSHPVM